MRFRWILLAVVAVVIAILVDLDRMPAPLPGPGVAKGLAVDRASRVTNLRYTLTFTVPAARPEPIAGREVVAFDLGSTSRPLALDFAQPVDHLRSIAANGQRLDPRIDNGHIVIPPARLVAGANTVEIDFTAGDESLNRNDDYLYTLFVPARASLAFPCFDQPDLKARYTLRLDLPADWTAVSNGRESGRVASATRLSLLFDETQPISTYLFAFAAGRFSIETAERNGRTFRMFHRETDAAKVAKNRDAIFDLHARAIAWLEQYTGIPYPFGKFDFVLIPAFQFGGMEHPGAIYYNASGLMLDDSATDNQRLGRANVISHETSHMWFGDLVTMKWFNDVWMKEVFANFMAAKIVNPSFPQVNHPLRFLLQNYPVAYDVDRSAGANPIRQDLANLNEAGTLYGAIIYQKAPIVMRQLELLVGEDAFRAGLRDYLKRFAFGNATWTDLIDRLTARARTQISLADWSHAWVDEPGRPVITTHLETEGGRIARLAFDERDPRGRGLVWPERMQVAIGLPGEVKTFDVAITGPHLDVPEATDLPAPLWVLPVGGGLAYGDVEFDPGTREYLLTSLHAIADPLTRGAALVGLWEAMLDHAVPPARVLAELLVAAPVETDALNLAQMLDDLRQTFWRFTPEPDRAVVAARIETMLRNGLDQAATTSLKAVWFNTLRSVATTPATLIWLEHVWHRDLKIDGLPLSEADEADLALDLAVRDIAYQGEVLQEELDRIKNPDRRARFAFVMPAVSTDRATRDRFFESLKDVKNRAHEAWVLDAERLLNHPLRAADSARYVIPALELVSEIQRTGDIFFPKRWADATLNGYQSAAVAAQVRQFIDRLPRDYPQRLRWVLLSAADPLFRAAER